MPFLPGFKNLKEVLPADEYWSFTVLHGFNILVYGFL